MDAVAPEMTMRRSASSDVATCARLRMAALWSPFSRAATSTAYPARRCCDVPRNRRQNERREKADDRQHADDFDQCKSGLSVGLRHYRDALLIRLCESPIPPAP